MTTTEVPTTWAGVVSRLHNDWMRHVAAGDDIRLGQSYFNSLNEIHPEVAEMVHGTMADPFYCDSYDRRLERFLDAIEPYFQ